MPQFIIIIATALFGLINCFFGYRIFKALLPIWGLFIGASLGVFLARELLSAINSATIIIAGSIGGLLGGVLFSYLYFLGVFMVGGLFAGMTVQALLATGNREWIIIISLGAGLVGGIIALLAQKIIIVIATSLIGAATLITALLAILEYEPMTRFFTDKEILDSWFTPALAGVFILGLTGIAVQMLVTSEMRRK